ncbi:MAG: GTPase Era [Bacteroidetes bacterium HGW-Bacteroidetes-21]|jgi:GTP-binding protein Era|nr:MAG: GTPase Era [Bacteroidetes bacterium HGW-Bacteroidetes-21]
MEHKAGFANILGAPNVGKSTLMNAMLGQKLSIISPKAQTTRHRILGILNAEEYQIVFSDTPGIINKPSYKMHEAMMEFVNQALVDADVFMFVTEATQNPDEVAIPEKLKTTETPVIHVLNKIDLTGQEEIEAKMEKWKTLLPNAQTIPVSAVKNFNVAKVLMEILNVLPVHPPYYDKDEMSDRSLRFFVSEIIREKILDYYHQEIPYSCEVQIDEFQEKSDITVIKAVIYVARDSQKSIIIGEKGKAIKHLGIEARKDIEIFLDGRIYLELFVKVAENWRENPRQLKRFGY